MDEILLFLKTHISIASINSVTLVIKLLEKLSMLKSVFTKKTVVITSVLILILSSTVTILMVTVFNEYEIHRSIEIDSDEDVLKYNFPGDGSEEFPFLIENFKFKTNELEDVHIFNTTYNFIIRNCYFITKGWSIVIYNQISGRIEIVDNTFKLKLNDKHIIQIAINMGEAQNISIERNRFLGESTNFQKGLISRHCSDISIQDNYFKSLTIRFSYSQNIIMNNNEIEIEKDANSYVSANDVTNITISSTVSTHDYLGLHVSNCIRANLFNNSLLKGDIIIRNSQVEEYYKHQIGNNFINGKEFGFFVNITDQELSEQYSSIHLIQSSNIIIIDQNQNGINTGMKLELCLNCSIVNNSIADSRSDSIAIFNSNHTLIDNNVISQSRSESIFIDSSPNTTIKDCSINDNYASGENQGYLYITVRSIKIIDSPNSTIENNQISSERCSLEMKFSPDSAILSNKFTSVDIASLISDKVVFNTLTIDNNTLNEKQLGIFIDQQNIEINQDYSQIIAINSSEITVSNTDFELWEALAISLYNCTNIILDSCSFTAKSSTTHNAIYFRNCSFVQIEDVSFENSSVKVRYCDNFEINNLHVVSLYNTGVVFSDGMNLTLENCFFKTNYRSLELSNMQNILISKTICNQGKIDVFSSDNITIQEIQFIEAYNCIGISNSSRINILHNLFQYEETAIFLTEIDIVPNNITIMNNTLLGGKKGIVLTSITGQVEIKENAIVGNSEEGIWAHHCDYVTISNNFIANNEIGVFLESSSHCLISYNIFERNTNFGVKLSSFSKYNHIYLNNFIENNIKGDYQVYDDGHNNRWNSVSLIGNFWSNCNQDNCGTDGTGLARDYHPLDEPVDIPYNASYFNIDTSENPINFWAFVLAMSLLTIFVLRKRKKS